jgi:hypothetical protein
MSGLPTVRRARRRPEHGGGRLAHRRQQPVHCRARTQSRPDARDQQQRRVRLGQGAPRRDLDPATASCSSARRRSDPRGVWPISAAPSTKPARSARDLMPLRTLRIIGKSPNSRRTSVKSAIAGDSHWYRCFRRVIRRVPPLGKAASLHAHVLSGFAHRSHRLDSKALTLNAVVSFTVLAIGIQSPPAQGRAGAGQPPRTGRGVTHSLPSDHSLRAAPLAGEGAVLARSTLPTSSRFFHRNAVGLTTGNFNPGVWQANDVRTGPRSGENVWPPTRAT